MKSFYLALILIFLSISYTYGQTSVPTKEGEIRGVVYNEQSGEKIFGVSILVNGESAAMTDLDGAYTISLPEGTYELEFDDLSYKPYTLSGVTVNQGEVTVAADVFLISPESQITPSNKSESSEISLSTVQISANRGRDSEKALMSIKKNSALILDGISADKIKLTGDGTAVEAAKRITGVSIEGGKYVYIRGLGDRYSKTTLNNIDIPGLDPDRNTLQMDIFPTNLMENILVSKNFTADLSADFTGGVLNIETKSFPTKKFTNISYGLSINPDMHFNKNYLYYKGGKTDFLGFDDGTRKLPSNATGKFPTPINSSNQKQDVFNFVNQFNKTLGVSKKPSLMNQDFSFSTGNQFRVGENRLAYIFALNYKNDIEFYDDYQYGNYQKNSDTSINELRYATTKKGMVGQNNVLIGALGGLAYKTLSSKYRLTAMHFQSGTSKAGKFDIDNSVDAIGQSGYLASEDVLEYSQRGLTNILLHGTHRLNDFEIEWRLSPTFSKVTDPDIRKTAFTYESIDTLFAAGAAGNPTRIWRYLEEFSGQGKLDLTKNYKFRSEKANLKFGGSYLYKKRDYKILQYTLQFDAPQSWSSYDPNRVLDPENIYPNGVGGFYNSDVQDDRENPNVYNSNATIVAGYVSNEMDLLPNFKTIVGVRIEDFRLNYSGYNKQSNSYIDNQETISSTNLFPTANVIWSLNKKMNIRAGYARTIARPSFKEASFAQIIDPISNRTFNGGLYQYDDWDGNIKETNINNYDLRWELFPKGSELFSISGFYKSFINPIELVRIVITSTGNDYQPRNVGNGSVYGVELEFRKSLDFISTKLENLSISSNITFAKSQIDMTESEYRAREQNKRDGETVENTRDMAGQAPYVLNAGIVYQGIDNGLQTGLFYNVKGKTLSVVGTGIVPDVYTQPFHNLNFSINKKLGKEGNTTIDFKVSNILDSRIQDLYESFNASNQIFESRNPGRTFSLGVSHNF